MMRIDAFTGVCVSIVMCGIILLSLTPFIYGVSSTNVYTKTIVYDGHSYIVVDDNQSYLMGCPSLHMTCSQTALKLDSLHVGDVVYLRHDYFRQKYIVVFDN